MNYQNLPNHNLTNGPGGQPESGADLPGFLANKLAPFTVEAAPDSYADIQARLGASRRRKGFWLWTTGALLLGGLLLGLLWQNMSPATNPTTNAIQGSKPSLPKAPKNMPEGSGIQPAQTGLIDGGLAQASEPAVTRL